MTENDGRHIRSGYTGDSIATKNRRISAEEAATSHKLFHIGFKSSSQAQTSAADTDTDAMMVYREINQIRTVLPTFTAIITPKVGATSSFNKRDTYEFWRSFRLNGVKKEKASKQAAYIVWNDQTTT
ncbi:unnamed protein product, partial [Absidia cylindrospora]